MPRKNTSRYVVALILFAFLLSCPKLGEPVRQSLQNLPEKTGAEIPRGRILEVRVEEANLLLSDQQAARNYLRTKLIGLLAERLSAFGFDPTTAATMATSGQAVEFEVRGHREKFAGRGADAGKIIEAEVFDVRGQLRLVLEEKHVAELCRILQHLPIDSLESAEKMDEYLVKMAVLSPPPDVLTALKERLAEFWFKILEGEMLLLRELKLTDQEPPELLAATEHLRRFSSRFPDNARLDVLYVQLAQGWLRWLLQIKERPLVEQRSRLQRFRQAVAGLLPLMEYVEKAVELAWRDRLFALDDGHAPFGSIRGEFLIFLEEFPSSRFYSDMELRFVERWIEYLLKTPVDDLQSLSSLLSEVRLLGERFPTLSQRGGVESRLGRECIRLLSLARPSDLEAMNRVRQVANSCEPFLPAGAETAQMKKNLDDIEQALIRERDDQLERAALKDLNFFISWDKAVRSLKWGAKVSDWTPSGDFARLWDSGRDAGTDCRCNLDPSEPCRIFQEESERGRYQVTLHFFENKLFGLDLCDLWVGDEIAAVYNFFARRYQRRHSPQQAAKLVATGEGEVTFGKKDDLLWILSCRMGTCLVQVRDARLFDIWQRRQEEESLQHKAEQEELRKQRLQKGWQKGDCVRWECRAECAFQGRVERREQNRYLVIVERSPENPGLLGRRQWVEESELYDCQ